LIFVLQLLIGVLVDNGGDMGQSERNYAMAHFHIDIDCLTTSLPVPR
jgi:hypothetical protein